MLIWKSKSSHTWFPIGSTQILISTGASVFASSSCLVLLNIYWYQCQLLKKPMKWVNDPFLLSRSQKQLLALILVSPTSIMSCHFGANQTCVKKINTIKKEITNILIKINFRIKQPAMKELARCQIVCLVAICVMFNH